MEFLDQQIVSGVFMSVFFLMSFFGRYPPMFKYDESSMISFLESDTLNWNSALFIVSIVCAIWLTVATLFRDAAEKDE